MTGWMTLRRQVYRRDSGRCQVCLQRVGRLWDCGHLVDRCVGGRDELSNLYLSCVRCNRTTKPIHRTRPEALAWLHAEQQRARTGREVGDEVLAFTRAMYERSS